ncbi:STM3941 family protein [Actinoplanes couchii]
MVVYRSWPRTLGLLLAAVVLVGSSAWLIWSGWGTASGTFRVVIGVVGVLFFGYGTVVIARQLGRRGPVVEVDSAGIRDRRLSEQVIPWAAVRDIGRTTVQRQEFVTLALDPAFEQSYLSGRNRFLQRLNSGAGWPGVQISTVGLSVRTGELFEAIIREQQAGSAT